MYLQQTLVPKSESFFGGINNRPPATPSASQKLVKKVAKRVVVAEQGADKGEGWEWYTGLIILMEKKEMISKILLNTLTTCSHGVIKLKQKFDK